MSAADLSDVVSEWKYDSISPYGSRSCILVIVEIGSDTVGGPPELGVQITV